MPFIIEHKYTFLKKDGTRSSEFTSYYQYSLTGNHMDGGNCFGAKESAKRFESGAKARRIAGEMNRLRKDQKCKAIEID